MVKRKTKASVKKVPDKAAPTKGTKGGVKGKGKVASKVTKKPLPPKPKKKTRTLGKKKPYATKKKVPVVNPSTPARVQEVEKSMQESPKKEAKQVRGTL